MKATITWNGTVIEDTCYSGLRRQMCAMLRVDGPRSLLAKVDDGGEIAVSLFEQPDYTLTPAQVARRDAGA